MKHLLFFLSALVLLAPTCPKRPPMSIIYIGATAPTEQMIDIALVNKDENGQVLDVLILDSVRHGACRYLPTVYKQYLYIRYTDDIDGEWHGPTQPAPDGLTVADCIELF